MHTFTLAATKLSSENKENDVIISVLHKRRQSLPTESEAARYRS